MGVKEIRHDALEILGQTDGMQIVFCLRYRICDSPNWRSCRQEECNECPSYLSSDNECFFDVLRDKASDIHRETSRMMMEGME